MLTLVSRSSHINSERVDFRVRKVIRDKEGRDKMMKGSRRQNSPYCVCAR